MSSQNIYDEAHHYNSEATLGDGTFGASRHAVTGTPTSSNGTMTPSTGGGDGVRQGFNTMGTTVADYSNSSTVTPSPMEGASIENYNGRPGKNGILGPSEGYAAAQQAASEQMADAANEKSDAEDNKMLRKQQMQNIAPRPTVR